MKILPFGVWLTCTMVLVLGAWNARATPHNYDGIYVKVDPYNPGDVMFLCYAAGGTHAACGGTAPPAGYSPFTGAVNGVFLHMNWCQFQDSPLATNSCHYYVTQPNMGSVSRTITTNDKTCEPGTIYNTCATGALSTVIGYLNAINSVRITAGLPQLKLSVGLAAGVWTPQSVLDAVGYGDFPHLDSSMAPHDCFRLPLLWKSAFVTQHEAALKQLVSYIVASAAVDITMLKVTGINDGDIEMEVPGRRNFLQVPADLTTTPPTGSGPLMTCPLDPPGTTGAQLWLSLYGAMTLPSYSNAFETTFGAIAGFEAGLIHENSLDALISIANTGSSGMASVDCGIGGGGPCTAQASTDTDDYNTYYIAKYAKDIFTTPSVANTAAASAYTNEIPGGTFALTARQMSVN